VPIPASVEEETPEEQQASTFEEKMLVRVRQDFADSEQFLSEYHRWCTDMHGFYHSGRKYVNLRQKNLFPSAEIQEDVDTFVADTRDKIFYAGTACRLIGREDTDKDDAEAKQQMMIFQDEQNGIFGLMGRWLQDAALYQMAIAQVDYKETTRREWAEVEMPLEAFEPETGEPIVDEEGNPIPLIDTSTGMVATEKQWVLIDVPDFKGSWCKHVDPSSVFFGQDKKETVDEFPIMIRTYQTRAFFDSQPYFFNQTKLKDDAGEPIGADEQEVTRRAQIGETLDASASKRPYQYIEWQGLVDRRELYEFLKKDKAEMARIKKGERTWAIVGVTNDKVVVRIDESPFGLVGPNIIIGGLGLNEGMKHQSLSDKLESIQRGSDDLMGMLMATFKLSIDAWTVINQSALVGEGRIETNKPGGILLTNTSVNDVVKQFAPPDMTKAIYTMLGMFKQSGENRGGIRKIISGQADPEAETLGEATQALSHAIIRMRDYLKAFEQSFIVPLYIMRNQINATLIDEEYVFMVIGESAQEWRTIKPEQVRASVHFICESSTRETNRSIIIQQMLQFIQLAPFAHQAGQPVRFDKMMAHLGEAGFTMQRDKIEEFFPLIKLEREKGVDVDGMLLEAAQQRIAMPDGGTGQAGQQLPRPRSESEANASNQARNRTQVGRT
jgi:hypothetical protein